MGKDKEKTPKVSAKMADLMVRNARLNSDLEHLRETNCCLRNRLSNWVTAFNLSWGIFGIFLFGYLMSVAAE